MERSKRKHLKALAHHIDNYIQVGKNGLTSGVVEAIDNALNHRELIKVKFQSHKQEKEELSKEISEKTGSHLVEVIGNVAIFYRRNPVSSKIKVIID
jgi:RNA-binding protein